MRRALKGLRHSSACSSSGLDPRSIPLCATDLKDPELVVVRWSQMLSFPKEITLLSTENGCLPKSSRLTPLNPILKEGLLRVGGRIQRAPVSDEMKFPLILSSDSPVSSLLVKDIHEKTGHGGKDQVLSRFWLIHGGSVVRRVVKSCVFCRRHFSSPLQQMMADLPSDRMDPEQPPFTNTGIDYFGPILVKRGRSQVKRYGALFPFLTCRAVHIEMAESLTTDAFINALRRFIARRGQVRMIRSDNGSNFTGAEKELGQAIKDGINLGLSHYFSSKALLGGLMPLGPPTMEVPGNDWFVPLAGLWWDSPGSSCWMTMDLTLCLLRQNQCWMAALLQDVPQIPMISPASHRIIFSFSKTNSLYLRVSSRVMTITYVVVGAKSNTWAICFGRGGYVNTWPFCKCGRNGFFLNGVFKLETWC